MKSQSYPALLKYGVLLIAIFGASCASRGDLQEAQSEPRLENLVEVQPASPVPAPIEEKAGTESQHLGDLTLPQTELVPKKLRDQGPRFSLSAEEVDVKSILFALSKEIDQNIMIDPEISKKVTLNLEEVTLKEMLDHVLLPLGLRYVKSEGFIQVIRREMQTRMFHLNYLISSREGSGNLQASPTGMDQENTPASSRIATAESTDLWEEISLGLQQMLSSEKLDDDPDQEFQDGKGWFSVNKQAGVIVVKAYPEVLLRVAEFLEEVEGSVQRQVFIEARIVQIALKDEFPQAIDWNRFTRLNRDGSERAGASGENKQDQGDNFSGTDDASLDQLMDALSYMGDVSVLASPKITALNNQRAVIKVAKEDSFFVQGAFRPAAMGQGEYIPRPVSLGVVLDVVPQINVNGNVMMSVHTRITKKAGERVSPDGLTSVPVVDVRESNNVVLARNGQTVVLGGLMATKKEPQTEPSTLMERVPFIGGWFKEDRATYEKSEMVILLTPQIMVGEAIDDRRRLEEKRLKRIAPPRQTYKMNHMSEGN